MKKGKTIRERILAGLLAFFMILSLLPHGVLANGAGAAETTTTDISKILKNVVLENVTVGDDGKYHVTANQPFSMKFEFRENDTWEMDMSNSVTFTMPEGVRIADASGKINIGVNVGGVVVPIYHDFVVTNNVITITWNKEHENFDDLFHAHYVTFSFEVQGQFDGTKDEITFDGDDDVIIKVDNTGSITITKIIEGLKSNVSISAEQASAMTFELVDEAGNVVKDSAGNDVIFTYAQMAGGNITYNNMKPGQYTVRETAHPDVDLYTFDASQSVLAASGTLGVRGQLNLGLKNIYVHDTGSLVLNKTIDVTNWDNSKAIPDSVKNGIKFKITGPYNYSKEVSYNEFTNGSFTLNGLEVGDYTITEINSVTGYTWTYKVNNASADTPVAYATVTKNGTASASFDNSYVQQTAKLTIEKTASGAAVPADAKFTVTGPDGKTYAEFTYSQMINGKYEIPKVPFGTYTVEEISGTANVATYKLAVTGTGTVVVDGDKTQTINNTYTPLGSLQISKTIAGDLDASKLSDAQKRAITFEVRNSSGKIIKTLSYMDILNGKGTITDLPVGTYIVKEIGGNIDGYTMTTDPANKERNVEVQHNQTATASFTNTYTKNTYTITVLKVVEGAYTSIDMLPDAIKDGTTFTIQKNGTVVKSGVTLRNLAAQLTNLSLTNGAGTYTVIENNPTVDGISIEVSVSKDGQTFTNGNSVDVEVKNHQPVTVTFKNKYTIQGKITGDKTITGLPSFEETALRGKITFDIYSIEGTTPVKYTTVTLAELERGVAVPAGTYKVYESGTLEVNGYSNPTVSNAVGNGTTTSGSATNEFVVGQNQTVTVHFTNAYTTGNGSGSLQLVKYVTGLEETGTKEVVLTRELNVNNTNNKLLYDGIKFKLEEKVNNTWQSYGEYTLAQFSTGVSLRPGQYKLTELYADVATYKHTVTFLVKAGASQINNGSGKVIEFTVSTSEALNVEIHNVYTPLGSIEIQKTIAGDLNSSSLNTDQKKAIVFKVYHTGNLTGTPVATVIYDKFKNGKYTVSNLPVGSYTVIETVNGTVVANYDMTVDHSQVEVQVTRGQKVIAAFTNTFTRQKGNLTIQKTMTGEVPTSMTLEQKQAMSFEVYSGDTRVKGPVTYDQFAADGTYTFTDLPTGTYQVRETIGGVLTDVYSIRMDGTNENVTVVNNGTTTVEITNTFTQTGTLRIVKNLAGANVDPDQMNLVFKYWMINADGTEVEGTRHEVNYSQFTDGSYTIKNLVPGTYRVEEVDNNRGGYTCSTTVSVNGGDTATSTTAVATITFASTATVTFTNTYGEVASLKITKGVTGLPNMTDAQKGAILFTVTSKTTGEEVGHFTYSDMTNGEKVITDLVPGQYTVTETITDPSQFEDYVCVTSYVVGEAVATNGTEAEVDAHHGVNVVIFTNAYTPIEPLSVVKSSSKTYVGMIEAEDGIKYPVWKFTLAIDNLTTLSTKNGTTTLTDVYDTNHPEWFRLITAEEAAALKLTDNVVLHSLVNGKEAPAVAYSENASGSDISSTIVISGITKDTAETCDFTYYLILHDRDALIQLNNPVVPEGETAGSAVEYKFFNTVNYKKYWHDEDWQHSTAEYVYKFTALDKKIINIDEQGNLYGYVGGEKVMVNYADYEIYLNKDAIWLGDETTIELKAVDEFSDNQTILLSSVVTVPGADAGVSFNLDNDAHKIEFTIPNGVSVKVSYRVAINDGDTSTVQLKNHISLHGYIDGVEREVGRLSTGSGVGTIYSIKLVKVDALNNNIKLAGVTYNLYDENRNLLTTQVTDSNGQINLKYWGTDGSFKVDHNYYLKEVSTIPGYNLDSREIWFKISNGPAGTVDGIRVLNNNGELIVSNEPIVDNLEVTKQFSAWIDEFDAWTKQASFQFKLEPVNGAPMPAAGGDVVTVTKDKPTGTFGLIRFADVKDEDLVGDKVVTYQYTIHEVINENDMVSGVQYDTTAHTATVTISDTNHDGVKEVSITYDQNKESLTVENKYEEVSVSVEKIWDDEDNKSQFRNADTSVTIELLAGGSKVEEIVLPKADGSMEHTWTGLPKYDKNTEIAYTVREVGAENNVINIGTDNYNANYGVKIETVTGDANFNFAVTNSYHPASVDVTFIGEKILRFYPDNDEAKKNAPSFTIKLSTAANGKAGELLATASIKAGEKFTFAPTGEAAIEALTFNRIGTYEFMIEEVNNRRHGIEYDTTVYNIKVVVTDNGRGQLVKSVTVNGEANAEAKLNILNFTNKYYPAPVKVQFAGEKYFTGYPEDAENVPVFTYVLTEIDENGEVLVNENGDPIYTDTKSTVGADSYLFDEIEYKKVGTHRYSVEEINSGRDGVTYDETVYLINVEVFDIGDGDLHTAITVEVISAEKDEESGEAAEGTEDDDQATDPDADEDDEIVTPDEDDEATNPDDEDNDGEPIIDPDEPVVLPEKALNFTNSYKPAPISVHFTGLKTLEGRELEDEEFTFTLAEIIVKEIEDETEDNTEEPIEEEPEVEIEGEPEEQSDEETEDEPGEEIEVILQTKTNDGEGLIDFDDITYEEVGRHVYVVREVVGELGGVTYAEDSYIVIVTVTDDGSGYLAADIEGINKDGSGLNIVNYYAAKPVDVKFSGVKTLEGRDLKAEEFSFVLMDGEKVLQTVKNDAEGNIKFEAVTFTAVGTYTFTVSEVKEDLGGVTYDDAIYTVVVTVTDDLKGNLVAKVSGINEDGSGLNFKNKYEAAPVEVSLGGRKILSGAQMKGAEFTFVLKQGDKTLQTVTNGALGQIRFEKLTFTEAGIYTYTVLEEAGKDEDMIYDSRTYQVVITVTDNGEGNLVAVISGDSTTGRDLNFVNLKMPPKGEEPGHEDPPGKPNTGDDSHPGMWLLMMLISAAGMKFMADAKKRKDEIEQ